MSARTAEVEGIEALAPWVHDLMSEVQGLRDQAKALEAQAKALEAELVEAANASSMGECPEWCSGTAPMHGHEWTYFPHENAKPNFLRQHTGRKGNRYAKQWEIFRGDSGRELSRIASSPSPDYITF